jgi:hypothetical protein
MLEQNLFIDLKLDTLFLGGAFKGEAKIENLEAKDCVLKLIDDFCVKKDLLPLGEDWNEISYTEFDSLLHDALQFDLGFTAYRVLKYDEANQFYNILMADFDTTKCKCFTNCFSNPWKNSSYSSNSVSQHTLDLVVVIVNSNKILVVYFFFED